MQAAGGHRRAPSSMQLAVSGLLRAAPTCLLPPVLPPRQVHWCCMLGSPPAPARGAAQVFPFNIPLGIHRHKLFCNGAGRQCFSNSNALAVRRQLLLFPCPLLCPFPRLPVLALSPPAGLVRFDGLLRVGPGQYKLLLGS